MPWERASMIGGRANRQSSVSPTRDELQERQHHREGSETGQPAPGASATEPHRHWGSSKLPRGLKVAIGTPQSLPWPLMTHPGMKWLGHQVEISDIVLGTRPVPPVL
ncbi:hypothetical protein L209DRAFT_782908 [Thermothelomyces heterothallicus CBS 203.75]